MGKQLLLTYEDIQAEVTTGRRRDNVFTFPDSTPAVLYGHKYWCRPDPSPPSAQQRGAWPTARPLVVVGVIPIPSQSRP
jgi:hypothetical protein